VMASKGVKALAIRGTGSIEVAHPKKFEKLVDEIAEEIYSHEQYEGRRRMGTTRILLMANAMGFLPTRHYTSGTFEHAEEVSGERLAEEFNVKSRGCFACTIPCSRFYVVREGRFAGLYGEGPEYESQGSLTSRTGNRELELALKANDMCNRLGMDILTVSECISWAMELYEKGMLTREETDGLDLSWGNGEAMLTLIEKISKREGFGDILADGSKAAAMKLGKGLDLTMQVKGLDLIMADPRGLKGFGLGYAVASRGGDHLRSEPFLELNDDPAIGEEMFGVPEATLRLADKGKGKLISFFEDWNAVAPGGQGEGEAHLLLRGLERRHRRPGALQEHNAEHGDTQIRPGLEGHRGDHWDGDDARGGEARGRPHRQHREGVQRQGGDAPEGRQPAPQVQGGAPHGGRQQRDGVRPGAHARRVLRGEGLGHLHGHPHI